MATIEELESDLALTKGKLATAEAKIKEVSDESKGHRLNSDNFRKRAEDLNNQLASEREQIETLKSTHATEIEKVRIDLNGKAAAAEKLAEETKANAHSKIMMADLKIAARESGMLDLDGLKLLNADDAKLDDDGNVTNAADLMTAMREAKPYLFGKAPAPGTATGTTGTTSPAPDPSTGNKHFNARTATAEEVKAQFAALPGTRR